MGDGQMYSNPHEADYDEVLELFKKLLA